MNLATHLKHARMTAIFVGIAALTFAGCGHTSHEEVAETRPTTTPITLAGEWSSQTCEAYPDGQGGTNYLKRSFSLTDDTWALDVDLFGDATCTDGLFSIEIEGDYTLSAASERIDDAFEGTFSFTRNTWTPHIEGLAEAFTQSGCGDEVWSVGVSQDVLSTGCLGIAHPVSTCAQEYDVVAIKGDALYFGERVTNMCDPEGRPTTLNSYPVTRQ